MRSSSTSLCFFGERRLSRGYQIAVLLTVCVDGYIITFFFFYFYDFDNDMRVLRAAIALLVPSTAKKEREMEEKEDSIQEKKITTNENMFVFIFFFVKYIARPSYNSSVGITVVRNVGYGGPGKTKIGE